MGTACWKGERFSGRSSSRSIDSYERSTVAQGSLPTPDSGYSAAVLSLQRAARTSALVASGAIALVGILAGAVRLMPWLLDPAVPWRVAAPFARGLAAVALEAALLVWWPVGWALAACRFVENGEARVLLTLGERPARTASRLAPQGLALALALAAGARVL